MKFRVYQASLFRMAFLQNYQAKMVQRPFFITRKILKKGVLLYA